MTTSSNINKKELLEYYFRYWLGVIKDETLRKNIEGALMSAPDSFWRTGNNGEHAPSDEVNDGALKRTWKTCYYAKGLARAWEAKEYMDLIIASCLLHDCVKYEAPSHNDHGSYTRTWLEAMWPTIRDEKEKTKEDKKLRFVARVLELHDGRYWSKGKLLSPIKDELQNVEKIGWLVHTAEFVSSRSKTTFDWGTE